MRPDLSYTALQMSKKNTNITIADLQDVNRILKKVRERDSHLRFGKIGEREELIVVGIGDASFKIEEKALGGVFLFLSNKEMTRAAPIFWKSNYISRVYHSSKDMETLNILKMV